MEENYQGYNQPEYENDDPRKGANKSILGYRIVIIILAVILAAITVLYYNIHRQQQADYDLLVIDRDSIQNNLSDLMQDFDDLQLSNDTLSLQMGIERQRADSLMQRLKQERSWSLAKIKQYEKEVGTLRTIMRGYLHQIDSLNTLNKKLIDENVSYRKEITTAQMRAEMAEEKAQELNNKVRQGSVINARGIRMVALNARSKEVSRIKNAERLRVDFTLTANALATPGERQSTSASCRPTDTCCRAKAFRRSNSRANASLTPHRVTWITRTKTSTSVSSTPAAASPPVPTRYRSIATGS